MFLISIKGKFNILVKIYDLQNFISYNQKPDFMKFHSRYSKSFLVYEILSFLPFYKVIVVDNFECCNEGFFQKAVNNYLRRYQNIYCKSSYAVLISILWIEPVFVQVNVLILQSLCILICIKCSFVIKTLNLFQLSMKVLVNHSYYSL